MNILCTFHIFMYGYVTEALGNAEYSFIAIAPRSTLVRSDST